MQTLGGLILAAGKSQRMGKPKLLLEFFGRTFLEHVYEEAIQSALSEVRIVIGHDSERIQSRFPNLKDKMLINPHYDQGQLSSIQCGLRHFRQNKIDGVMVFLIDHPFVNRTLIDKLIKRYNKCGCSIVIPSYRRRRGHPIIFAESLFDELLNAPADRGAVSVVRRHEREILHVEVDNPGVLIDIDTPEDYLKYVTLGAPGENVGGISKDGDQI